MIIQHYFGELSAHDCGICDYCIQKAKPANRFDYDERIRHQIFEELNKKAVPIQSLLAEVDELEKEDWIMVIRLMLDTEELYYDEHGNLHPAGSHVSDA